MSRGAPGVRHISGVLKARIERGFEQVHGRRMSDFDFSVMSLQQARQYAGLDGQADERDGQQTGSAVAAAPARARMTFRDQADRTMVVGPQSVPVEESSRPISMFMPQVLRRKMVAVPAMLVLILGCGGGVLAMAHGSQGGASSQVVKPSLSPVSDQLKGRTPGQQSGASPVATPTPESDTPDAGTSTVKTTPRTPTAAPRQSTPPASSDSLSPPPALLPDSPTPSQPVDPTTSPPPVTPPADTPITPPAGSDTPSGQTPPPPPPPTPPTPPVDLPSPTSV